MKESSYEFSEVIYEFWLAFEYGIVSADLTGPERKALYRDVVALQEEEGCSTTDAVQLLRRRIGGDANLRSYVNCLMAKENQ